MMRAEAASQIKAFEDAWTACEEEGVLHGNHVARVVNGKRAVTLSLEMDRAGRVCASYIGKSLENRFYIETI